MSCQLTGIVNSYLLGQLSLDCLEDWLLSHLQEILDGRDQKTIELANAIDAGLIALNEGTIDEAGFYRRAQTASRLAETHRLVRRDSAVAIGGTGSRLYRTSMASMVHLGKPQLLHSPS